MKGKLRATDATTNVGQGSSDKSKYKKLEMQIFTDEDPESWVYHAKHFFEIDDLAKAEGHGGRGEIRSRRDLLVSLEQ